MLIDDEVHKILVAIITLDDNDTSFYYRFSPRIGTRDIFEIRKILSTNYNISSKFLEDKIYQMEF